MDLKDFIRDVPNWPRKGIVFRDITPLLGNREAFSFALEKISMQYRGREIDLVVSPESRGFIFGSALAGRLGAGFVPARKGGKLPWKKLTQEYELEYGRDSLEIHRDAIRRGQRVLVCDDLLATGGTVSAVKELVRKAGGLIEGFCFLIELEGLRGRDKLKGYEVFSLIKY
jgi:adenine phosphoribosyltransferase